MTSPTKNKNPKLTDF